MSREVRNALQAEADRWAMLIWGMNMLAMRTSLRGHKS